MNGSTPPTSTSQPGVTTGIGGPSTTGATVVDTLAYPISPDYVKSWVPVRAVCELIANALDEDRDARIWWADGILHITDDGPGIPEEGLILGYSTKTSAQIGQFGEGKKLAFLVLARTPEVGAVRCETVGYGFTPTVERRRLLGGLIPSRSAQGAEVLVYHLYRTDRQAGTTITVECPEHLAVEAVSRFRALTEPGYKSPQPPGACVSDGAAGRVWIGGVLVTTVAGFLASYDLPLRDKALQNRDRTVIEAGALRTAVRAILAANQDTTLIGRFAQHALAGGKLREPEQFFSHVTHPLVRAAWRAWARHHLPDHAFYTDPGNEEAALDLRDKGFTELTAPGLPAGELHALMALLGVEVARTRQRRHYDSTRATTTWVPDRALTAGQRAALADAVHTVRRAIGGFALDRVRVYSASEQSPCASGFYTPSTGDVAVHLDILDDRHQLLATLLHEAGHRVGHRGGGPFLPIADYTDRSRGFENTLTDFAARLLRHLADGTPLPDHVEPAPAPATATGRRSRADDPSVPAVRRELARLLTDQLPHALAARGFATAKDLVASTAVHPDFWRTLTCPRPLGYRGQMGRGRAWDYDKTSLLADAVGVYPPVVWLAYNLCEGPIYGRRRDQQNQPGPWSTRMRAITERACADLDALGGPYAAQAPALRDLLNGQRPATTADDSWHQPARTLLTVERQRLRLDTPPAADAT